MCTCADMCVCKQEGTLACIRGTGWSRQETEVKLTFTDQLGTWHIPVQQPAISKKQRLGQDGEREACRSKMDRRLPYSSASNRSVTGLIFKPGGLEVGDRKPASGTS